MIVKRCLAASCTTAVIFTIPAVSTAAPQDDVASQSQVENRPEVRSARSLVQSLVIREMDRIAQSIRDGMNVDQLSPMELSLLRRNATAFLNGVVPEDTAKAASDAAGPGLDLEHHVFVDNSRSVVSAWRWMGGRWVHAGFVDPAKKLSEDAAFAAAMSRPDAAGEQ